MTAWHFDCKKGGGTFSNIGTGDGLGKAVIFTYLLMSLTLEPCATAENTTGLDGVFNFNLPTPTRSSSDICYGCTERVNHALNFTIQQDSPRLADLFDTDGSSQLCFPTALAEALAYLYHYRKPPLSELQLAGLSQDRLTLDGVELARSLATLCHTDRHKGTQPVDALTCTLQTLKMSGYDAGDSGLLTWRQQPNPGSAPIELRQVTADDLRYYVKRGDAVLLHVGWYVQDDKNSWHRHGGHFIGIYGYDYTKTMHGSSLVLKVSDPREHYDDRTGRSLDYADVHVEKISAGHFGTLPSPLASLTLTGPGFNGRKLPIIESILHFAPK